MFLENVEKKIYSQGVLERVGCIQLCTVNTTFFLAQMKKKTTHGITVFCKFLG